MPKEKAPFSGFLPRLGAFLIDCVLIFYVIKVLDMVARPTLLGLNPLLPWLGFVLAWLYFWIGNGPWTKGRTLGKLILSLHVIDPEGRTLTPGAAGRRATVQGVAFLLLLNFAPEHYTMIFPPELRYPAGVVISLAGVVALAFMLTLIFSIVMHPCKRAWHDLVANSYVTPDPTPMAFRQTLDGEPSLAEAGKLKFIVIFLVLASVTLLLRPVKVFLSSETREKARELAETQKKYSVPPYTIMNVDLPNEERRMMFLGAISAEREQARSKGEQLPTTDTLRAKADINDETIFTLFARRTGAFSPEDLKDPVLRKDVEELRRDLWAQWCGRTKVGDAKTSSTLQARSFMVLLIEPLQVLYYNGSGLRAKIHGPADPAAGALTYEEVHEPEPRGADQATTSTTPAPRSAHETTVKP